jgi:hypothetical protein
MPPDYHVIGLPLLLARAKPLSTTLTSVATPRVGHPLQWSCSPALGEVVRAWLTKVDGMARAVTLPRPDSSQQHRMAGLSTAC